MYLGYSNLAFLLVAVVRKVAMLSMAHNFRSSHALQKIWFMEHFCLLAHLSIRLFFRLSACLSDPVLVAQRAREPTSSVLPKNRIKDTFFFSGVAKLTDSVHQ